MKKMFSVVLTAVLLLAATVSAFGLDISDSADGSAFPALAALQEPASLPCEVNTLSGKDITDVDLSEKAYTYTNWNGEAFVVDLYTIAVPQGTSAVRLSFDEPRLCYNYAFTGEGMPSVTDGDYLCGAVEDDRTQDGRKVYTVPVDSPVRNYDGSTMPADGAADYVQIQTAYDSDWNTSVLYAITFKIVTLDENNINMIFGDVENNSDLAKTAVWAVNNKVCAGIGGGLFGADSSITRDQMVTLLWNLAGQPEPAENAEGFSDVVPGAWFEKAAVWAKENSVCAGTGGGRFGAGQTLTRSQLVWFIANYFGLDHEDADILVPESASRADALKAVYLASE